MLNGLNLLKACGLTSCLRAQLLTAKKSIPGSRLSVDQCSVFAVAVRVDRDVIGQGGTAEADPAEVSPAEDGPVEVGLGEVSSAKVSPF